MKYILIGFGITGVRQAGRQAVEAVEAEEAIEFSNRE